VTAEGGTAAGAVYSPLVEMVPFVESPPTSPFTLQAILVLAEPLTAAMNCWVWETCSDALEGDTVTEIVGGPFETNVTLALADFDESTVLVTDTVTEAGDGSAPGAV